MSSAPQRRQTIGMVPMRAMVWLSVIVWCVIPFRTLSSADQPPPFTNHLANEQSPYLLQHAHNPVDWYPWGPAAFAKAVAENKPIFLSIGYSTCHWCHVMERESFEDPAIAALLNHSYVAIKVDREERPDIDRVYMEFIQATTGNGGWPMTVFLTPDLKPFVGGTYFPPLDDHGMPGLASILPKITDAWAQHRDEVIQQADGVSTALSRAAAEATAPLSGAVVGIAEQHKAFDQLQGRFDTVHGGFGRNPKFPEPVQLAFLLGYSQRHMEPQALEMVTTTLRAMADGGIHDQIAGGMHRYSTDERWFLPHFEKMLYDQAQIAAVALDAFLITHDPAFADLARDILDYVLHDMTGPEGQFYAAEDADSPRPASIPGGAPGAKAEGAFYVWSSAEIEHILGAPAAALIAYRYEILPSGNVSQDPRAEFPHLNVLAIAHSLSEVANHAGITPEAARQQLAAARLTLASVRSQRPRPDRDGKVITSWNGLMISAFARASAVLDDERYGTAAQRAATFLVQHATHADGDLSHSWCAGQSSASGYLTDYATVIQAYLDCYETTLDSPWLARAMALQSRQEALFANTASGGYFTNAGDDPHLVRRLTDEGDNAEPAGVSVAVHNLTRLACMLDDAALGALADRAIATWASRLTRTPLLMPMMLDAAACRFAPVRQVVIAGDPHAADVRALLRVVAAHYHPDVVIVAADGGAGQHLIASHAATITTLTSIQGAATAYVCDHFVCQKPVTRPDELARLLEQTPAPAKP